MQAAAAGPGSSGDGDYDVPFPPLPCLKNLAETTQVATKQQVVPNPAVSSVGATPALVPSEPNPEATVASVAACAGAGPSTGSEAPCPEALSRATPSKVSDPHRPALHNLDIPPRSHVVVQIARS